MSLRMIQPDEIRVGQTIRVVQRWFGHGPVERWTKMWRGEVAGIDHNNGSVSIVREGETKRPIVRDTSDFTVEITLLAEPVDPRKDVIVRTLRTSLYITITQDTAGRLADRILSNLDKMEDA